jgi:precorrin-2 dehydrogenase/sirohydrochlorin ferrochelatase
MGKPRVYFPLMADITERKCVVVGGGAVGWRKAAALLECGASVTVVAPDAVPELEAAAAGGTVTWLRRPFASGDLDGAALAFAATNDAEANRYVRQEAALAGVWLNAAYDAEQGDFIVPSILRRGKLVMAVTTGGASPKLARRIAGDWAGAYGPEYESYVNMLEQLRRCILASDASAERKQACLADLLNTDLMERLRAGESEERAAASVWERLQETLF